MTDLPERVLTREQMALRLEALVLVRGLPEDRGQAVASIMQSDATLRAQVAALTAEREALVPLVQMVDGMAWTAGANVLPGIHFTTAPELEGFLRVLIAARRNVEGKK